MRYLPLLLALLLVPAAGAAVTPSPPAALTAQRDCKILGLTVGTQPYSLCIAVQLAGGSGKATPPVGAPTTQPGATLVKQLCRKLGLKSGTQAFTRCLNLEVKLAKLKAGASAGGP